MRLLMLAILATALSTAATGAIARALAPERWKRRKPFNCAVCLSVWGGLLVAIAQALAGLIHPAPTLAWVVSWGLDYLAACALSILVLSWSVLHASEAGSASVLDP